MSTSERFTLEQAVTIRSGWEATVRIAKHCNVDRSMGTENGYKIPCEPIRFVRDRVALKRNISIEVSTLFIP